MGSLLNSYPDHIEIFKPSIDCGLILHLSPDPLLGVEHRLVRRKASQANSWVGPQETLNFFPLMPPWPHLHTSRACILKADGRVD